VILPEVQRRIVGPEGQAGHERLHRLVCLVLDVCLMEMEEKRGSFLLSDARQSMYRQDLAILCISEASTPVFQDRVLLPTNQSEPTTVRSSALLRRVLFCRSSSVYVDDPMTVIPIRFLAKHSTIPFGPYPLSRWIQAVAHAPTFRLHVSAIVCGSGTIF
jgi:hypothetical protein